MHQWRVTGEVIMHKRRALAIAFATALGALTAAAATHPASLHNAFARAHSVAASTERNIVNEVRGGRVETLQGHAASEVDARVASVRPRAKPVALNEIDVPALLIRAGGDGAPVRTRPAAVTSKKADAACSPSWRSLDSGPSDRLVRVLCPSEITGSVKPTATAPEADGVRESDVKQRLEVPHAFLGDHLVHPGDANDAANVAGAW
jgi:hypothetical protein